jgi:fibronectin-binding autotransporter adhesin
MNTMQTEAGRIPANGGGMNRMNTMKRTCGLPLMGAAVVALSFAALPARAASGTWSKLTNGTYNWGDPANWTSSTVADGVDSTATFPTPTGGSPGIVTVTNAETRTIGNVTATALTFTTNYYKIGGAPLKLERTGGTKPVITSTIGAGGSSGKLEIMSDIISTNGFEKKGNGWLFLSGTNKTYTGDTVVSAGYLDIGNATSGGLLGNGNYSGNVSVAAGLQLRPNYSAPARQIFSGVISGAGGVIIYDSGTTVFAGANTLTGSTTMGSILSTLLLANSNALQNSTLNFQANTVTNLLFSPGIGTFNVGGLTGTSVNAKIDLADTNGTAITLRVGNNNATTAYAGALSGAGNLIKAGSGTQTLSGTNTYAGDTTVSGGALSISLTNSLPGWNVNGRYSVAGGAALLVGNAVTDADVAAMLGTTNFAAGAAIGFDTATATRYYSGNLADTAQGALGLQKNGTGTLWFTNNSSTYTFTGNIAVNAGYLNVGSNVCLGTSGTYAGNITLSAGNGTRFNWQSDADQTFTGSIVSSGTNTDSIFFLNTAPTGSGTVTLAAANPDFTSRLIVGNVGATNAATLLLSHSNALQSASLEPRSDNKVQFSPGIGTFNIGSLANAGGQNGAAVTLADTAGGAITLSVGGNNLSSSYNGWLSGPGGLTKVGSGTQTLSGTNTYAGATTVRNGVLKLTHPKCLSVKTDVWLYTGATNELAFAGTNDIHSLYIDGIRKAVRVYGTNNLPTVLTGPGCLRPLTGDGTLISFH